MTKKIGTIHEDFDLSDLELRPDRFFDVEGRATYDIKECDCTSECGDQSVTEHWLECNVIDFTVDRLSYYVGKDGVETIRIPVDAISEEDRETIKEALSKYEP